MIKTLRTVAITLAAQLLTLFIFVAVEYSVRVILYPALSAWVPSVFPNFSAVTEKESYDRLYTVLTVVSVALSVMIGQYISVRLDNERCEYMIDGTDGLYTVAEGAARYFPRYILPDLAAAAVASLPLPLLSRLLPDIQNAGVQAAVDWTLAMADGMSAAIGTAGSILAFFVLIFASRMLAGLISVRAWRAVWLSDVSAV